MESFFLFFRMRKRQNGYNELILKVNFEGRAPSDESLNKCSCEIIKPETEMKEKWSSATKSATCFLTF